MFSGLLYKESSASLAGGGAINARIERTRQVTGTMTVVMIEATFQQCRCAVLTNGILNDSFIFMFARPVGVSTRN